MEFEINDIDEMLMVDTSYMAANLVESVFEPVIFRVQLLAIKDIANIRIPDTFAVHAIDIVYENGYKKIIAGKFPSYDEAKRFNEQVKKDKQFNEAFIVAYRGGNRIDINKARDIKQSHP